MIHLAFLAALDVQPVLQWEQCSSGGCKPSSMALGRHSLAGSFVEPPRVQVLDARPGAYGRPLFTVQGSSPAADPAGTFFAMRGLAPGSLHIVHGVSGAIMAAFQHAALGDDVFGTMRAMRMHSLRWTPDGRGLCCRVDELHTAYVYALLRFAERCCQVTA